MVKKDYKGFTLVELMVSLVVFAIVLAGVYASYISSAKHSLRQHKIAESEMGLEIGKNFIKRDIIMSGYGLAEKYDFNEDGIDDIAPLPIAIGGTNGALGMPDTLTIMGTAVGRVNRASQGWSDCITTAPPTFQVWGDAREDVAPGDMTIFMEPNTKTLLDNGAGGWEFPFQGANPGALQKGTAVYGLDTVAGRNFSYYVVRYSLGGVSPSFCAPGTVSLLRGESRNTNPPANNQPLLSCVLNFQVAFGLDTDGNGDIDFWDNGGSAISFPPYSTQPAVLKARVKQVRVYVLVQSGSFNADEDVYSTADYPTLKFWVGDQALNIGGEITLADPDLRRYRWRVVPISVYPRNLR